MALVYAGQDLGWVDDGTGGNALGAAGGQGWTPPAAVTPTATGAPAASGGTAMWDYAKAQNTGFVYTPQQLGWDAVSAQKLAAAGITKLPGWFAKPLIMSSEFHLGTHDPVQNFIDLYTGSADSTGAASKARQSLTAGGGDPNDPAFKEAYMRDAFGFLNNAKDSWWDRNKSWVTFGGGTAAIAAGGLAAELGALGSGAAGAGVGTEAGGGWLGALEGSMGAYGPGGAGAAGELGSIGAGNALAQGFGTLGGDIAGFSNATPIATNGTDLAGSIAAGQAAGADVGMGAGTSWLTDLGLPASYGSGLGGLAGYGYDALGSAATSGGAKVVGNSSIWDTVSGLFGGSGGGGISDNALLSLINAGIGGAGTYFGGQAQANASDKASDTLWNMYQQSRADSASQRALLDQSLPFMQDRTYNAQSYMPTIPTLQNEVSVDYANDPIYQAQQNELLRTLNRRYASQGRNMSSSADDAVLRGQVPLMQDSYSRNLDTLNRTNQNALSTYGLGYQQQGDIYGRGLDLTKIGAGAAAQAGQNALSSGNAMATNQTAAGNNTANMYGGLAGVGMGSINNYMLYNLLSQRKAA